MERKIRRLHDIKLQTRGSICEYDSICIQQTAVQAIQQGNPTRSISVSACRVPVSYPASLHSDALQPRFIHSRPALDQTLPLCSCQAATSFFLTPSSHCAGVTPLASNSQFSTRRCVTSISSIGWEASRRVRVSLKNPARQSAASFGSDSDGRAGVAGAVSRAGRIEEYQSTQVPMRSKMMALGIAGDVDTADIATDVSLQVKMREMNGLR